MSRQKSLSPPSCPRSCLLGPDRARSNTLGASRAHDREHWALAVHVVASVGRRPCELSLTLGASCERCRSCWATVVRAVTHIGRRPCALLCTLGSDSAPSSVVGDRAHVVRANRVRKLGPSCAHCRVSCAPAVCSWPPLSWLALS